MRKQSAWLIQGFMAAALLGTPALPAWAAEEEAGEQSGASEPVIPQESWSPETAEEALDEKAEILELNGETLTVWDLNMLYRLRPMPRTRLMPGRDIGRLRGDDLERVGRFVGSYDLIAEEAKEAETELNEEQQERLEETTEQYTNSLLYDQEILSKIEDPLESRLREKYEEQKETRFRQQEELRLRHIFVSTYEPYRVEAGDTLESIAGEIAGDEELADRILSEETKKPRVEYLKNQGEGALDEEEADTPEEDDLSGEELPPRALMEGEMVMVPVSEDQTTAAQEKIQAAYEALESGESFQDVADEYSESGSPGSLMRIRPEEKDREIMPVLQETFMALEDGAYSEPIKTKHGYQVIYREKYTPSGYKPFESVRSQLERESRNELINEEAGKFFGNILAMDAVEINEEAIGAEQKSPDDVLVTIGDQEYTRGELNEQTNNALQQDRFSGVEGFREFVWRFGQTQSDLAELYKENSGFNESDKVKWWKDAIRNTILTDAYVNKKLDEQAGEPSEDEIKEFYEENKERYHQRESYVLRQVSITTDPGEENAELAREQAVEKLQEELKGVQSEEEFSQLADEHNSPEMRSGRGGNIGRRYADNMEDSVVKALRAVDVPGKTEVVFHDGQASAFWVQSAQEENTPTLEEKRAEIITAITNQKKNELREDLFNEYGEKVDVKVLGEAQAN